MVCMKTPIIILSLFLAGYAVNLSAKTFKQQSDNGSIPRTYSSQPDAMHLLGEGLMDSLRSGTGSKPRSLSDQLSADLGVSPRVQKIRTEFDKLGCAPLTAIEDGEGVRVTGFIGSQDELDQLEASVRSMDDIGMVDFQVVVTSPSFCDILQVSLPLHERNSIESAGASISVDGNAVVLQEDDKVVLRATAPTFDSYVYIIYLQEDGTLLNLVPSATHQDNQRKANESFSIGERPDQPSFSVAPPYGDDLVMILAASEPLFAEPRPLTEIGSSFAQDLAARVNALLSKGGKIVADLVFLRTSPKAS